MLILPATFGPLTLHRKLGTGSVAETYLGSHAAQPGVRVVARRILPWVRRDPSKLAAVERRIADLRGLSHPLLVDIRDYLEVGEERFLIEGMAAGDTLERILSTCRQGDMHFPPHVCLHIAIQVCNALEALHGRSGQATGAPHLLHLSLKPGAIYVTPRGDVVLGSLGLGRSPVVGSLTAPVPIRIEYLAPEQTTDDTALSTATDVFSLAAICYEMATLQPLFRGESNLHTLQLLRGDRNLDEPLARAAQRVPGLDTVLRAALHPNPAARTARARTLRDSLRGCLAGFTLTSIAADTEAFLGPIVASTHVPEAAVPAPLAEEAEERTDPAVGDDPTEITSPGAARSTLLDPLPAVDEDTRETHLPPPMVVPSARPRANLVAQTAPVETTAASILPEPARMSGPAAPPAPLRLPEREDDTFDQLHRAAQWRAEVVAGLTPAAPAPKPLAPSSLPDPSLTSERATPFAPGRGPSRAATQAPAGLGGLRAAPPPPQAPATEAPAPPPRVEAPSPAPERRTPAPDRPPARSLRTAIAGVALAVLAGLFLVYGASRNLGPEPPAPAPPTIPVVMSSPRAPVASFASMTVPGSSLTWGAVHERAWAGRLTAEEAVLLETLPPGPARGAALRYLLVDSERRNAPRTRRKALDALLALPGMGTSADLLAVDARERANAGDREGARAAAEVARARLESLDEEARAVATAQLLAVDAVLSQAALADDPRDDDLRDAARQAWKALDEHAARMQRPELQALARGAATALER
jgi:serine/threonine protein kinase